MAEEIEKNIPAAEDDDAADDGTIMLEDEDGKQMLFDKLGELDYNNKHYVAVMQQDAQAQQEGYAVIFSIEQDEQGEYFDIVEDDELLLKLGKLFDKQLGDDFGIEE